MNHHELPPPARFNSHASIAIEGRFATAAVMRPGVGCQVRRGLAADFVGIDIRDTQNRRVVVCVGIDGVPALIASLQDAIRGTQ